MDKIKNLLDKIDGLLKGEAVRAIGYGAAAVVVAVVAVSNAVGYTRFGENIDINSAIILTTAAITTLTTLVEGIRRFVFSQNSVVAIAVKADVQGADVALAEAGVEDLT